MMILLDGACTMLYVGEPDCDGVRLIRVYPEYIGGVFLSGVTRLSLECDLLTLVMGDVWT